VFSKTDRGRKPCRAVSGTAPSFFGLIQAMPLLEIFALSHFLDANWYPLRLKML
jgi:hypothetical protein